MATGLLDLLLGGGVFSPRGDFPAYEPDPQTALELARRRMYGPAGGSPQPGGTALVGAGPLSDLNGSPFVADPFSAPYRPQDFLAAQQSPSAPNLPAWASSFGAPSAPVSDVVTPSPEMQRMLVSLNTGGGRGRYSAPINPQMVSPGVSALPTTPVEPTPGERATAAALGFLNRGSILGGIADAIGGYTTGQRTDKAYLLQQQQQNQANTAKAVFNGLMARGEYQPNEALAIAQSVAGDKEVAKALLPNLFGQGKPFSSLKFNGVEVPITRDAQGGFHIALPGGELGSLADIQQFANDQKQSAAKAEALGKDQAAATAKIPSARAAIENVKDTIAQLKGHKGESASTGMILGHLPAGLGSQADYVKLWEQLQGEVFLNAYTILKGGGPISNAEGNKAQVALNAASRITDPATRNRQLDKAIEHLDRGFKALQESAKGNYDVEKEPSNPWQNLPGGIRIREKR